MARLPDPTDVDLRRWVVGRLPEKIHREVCVRLRARGFLVDEALRLWGQAGCPGWGLCEREVPLSLRLQLAEWLSIQTPLARVPRPMDPQRPFEPPTEKGRLVFGRGSLIPLLPFGSLVTPNPIASPPGLPTPEQERTAALIRIFQRRLITNWWRLRDEDAALLQEFEQVRAGLGKIQPPYRRLKLLVGEDGRPRDGVRIAGRLYPVPRKALKKGSLPTEPSRLAAILIPARKGGHARKIEARLTRARGEASIGDAWRRYGDWLAANPGAQRELDEVLPREASHLPPANVDPRHRIPAKRRSPGRPRGHQR